LTLQRAAGIKEIDAHNRMSASASNAAVASPATNTQTLAIDLGIGSAIRGNPEEQRAYITSKEDAIKARESEIETRYGPTLLRANARDAEILNKLFEEQRKYLSQNTNTSQKTIEDTLAKSNNKIDTIVNGLTVRTALLQLIEIFETTIKSQPTINNKALTDSDKRALLDAADALGKFYNANQEGTKDIYLKAIVDILITLRSKNAIFDEYLTTILAAGPEYADIVRAIRSRSAGVVAKPTNVILWGSLFKKISITFITALIVGLALWGGTLAANDAIFRSKGYRVLNFIYGSIFCVFVLPYYLLRYFKGAAPTLFALLPLTTYQPQSIFEKLIYGLFWYIENKPYEEYLRKRWYEDAKAQVGSSDEEGNEEDASAEEEASTEEDASADAQEKGVSNSAKPPTGEQGVANPNGAQQSNPTTGSAAAPAPAPAPAEGPGPASGPK